jgi:hypothetical protein
MRLWSLHPEYLDRQGIVALWREALLAKKVLENKTKGYKNHPQLIRFKKTKEPLRAINNYLSVVYIEAVKRNYNFDESKFESSIDIEKIEVTLGQMVYELNHLKKKLSVRDNKKLSEIISVEVPESNPVFKVVKGEVEEWERR